MILILTVHICITAVKKLSHVCYATSIEPILHYTAIARKFFYNFTATKKVEHYLQFIGTLKWVKKS